MQTNGNGIQGKKTRAAFQRWQGVHLATGVVVALWLVMMSLTGVAVNHQEDWALTEVEISNRYLPSHYTDEFHPETNRLNVVLTDLHSGRFFGAHGKLVSDAIALLVLISVGSGLYSYLLRRRAGSRPMIEIKPMSSKRAASLAGLSPSGEPEVRPPIAASKTV